MSTYVEIYLMLGEKEVSMLCGVINLHCDTTVRYGQIAACRSEKNRIELQHLTRF
jgi:hypothetical protein